MKSTLLLLLVSCVVFSADARTMRKRQLSSAAVATNAVNAMVGGVGNTLANIPQKITSTGVAMVRWAGNLQYSIKLAHGKTIVSYSNSNGGVIAITKRNLALVGAQADVTFTANGQQVAVVYLTTFFDTSFTSEAKFYSGASNFAQQTVTNGNNAALVIAYIAPGNSAEVSNNEVSYPWTSSSSLYNAQSSDMEVVS